MRAWYIKTKRLLPIIGTVALVGLLYHRLDLHRITNLRQAADWGVLLITAFLTLPFVLVKAFKWHQLLKTNQSQTAYTLALRSFLIGMGASLFTPARVGELARVACFPKPRLEVFTLVIVDKFIDMSVLSGCFLLSLMLLSPWIGLVGVFGLGCLWILIYTGFKFTKSTKWISHKPWRAERIRLLRQLLRRLIAFNACFACACLGLMSLQFYLLLSSLEPVGWQVGLMLPIILVVSSLPISIMGLGLREGTAALLLSRYGVPMEAAVAAAFSLFVINALLPGLVGVALSPPLLKVHKGQKKVKKNGRREDGKSGSKDGWTELKGLFHASRFIIEVLKMGEGQEAGKVRRHSRMHFTHHVSGQGGPSHSDWRLKDD